MPDKISLILKMTSLKMFLIICKINHQFKMEYSEYGYIIYRASLIV